MNDERESRARGSRQTYILLHSSGKAASTRQNNASHSSSPKFSGRHGRHMSRQSINSSQQSQQNTRDKRHNAACIMWIHLPLRCVRRRSLLDFRGLVRRRPLIALTSLALLTFSLRLTRGSIGVSLGSLTILSLRGLFFPRPFPCRFFFVGAPLCKTIGPSKVDCIIAYRHYIATSLHAFNQYDCLHGHMVVRA